MKNQAGAAVEAHLPGGRLEQLLLEWKQAQAQRDDLEPRMLLKASALQCVCVSAHVCACASSSQCSAQQDLVVLKYHQHNGS